MRPSTPSSLFAPPRRAAMRLSAGAFDPLREVNRKSRFFVGNGFLGLRGDRLFSTLDPFNSPPDAYVAGLFGQSGRMDEGVFLIPPPDFRAVRLSVGGEVVGPSPPRGSRTRIDLDFRRGVMVSEGRFQTDLVDLRLRWLHLVSHRDRALYLQLAQIDVIGGSALMVFQAQSPTTAPWLNCESGRDVTCWRTHGVGLHLGLGSDWLATLNDQPLSASPTTKTPGVEVSAGDTVLIARVVAAARASDARAAVAGVRRALKTSPARSWPVVLDRHIAAWSGRWRSSAVAVAGDAPAQAALNYAVHHLNSAANPDDERVSIGARGLTGHGYGGHVFWDTETLLLPYYCATWPEAARALLMYRGRTLDEARRKAREMGFRGALFAWESADTGAEAAPREVVAPDRRLRAVWTGQREHHVSADVAWGVWRYWRWSQDDDFMADVGAEILLETARFWASRARPGADGRSHILNVIGPDEYHEAVDDNAFTNEMARWNIRRGLAAARWLLRRRPERCASLRRRLDLGDAELDSWREVTRTLASGRDPTTGVYEQFSGYDALEPVDLTAYADRSVPMDVILGPERTQASQVIKQADVVALAALLPHLFTPSAARANFEKYAPKCGHGSSLSAPTHGLVAARLGLSDTALDFFNRTAALDLDDRAVGLGEGVHIAGLAGLWQIAVLGFGGVADGPALTLRPRLPRSWTELRFPLAWRGRRLTVAMTDAGRTTTVRLLSGPSCLLRIAGRPYPLARDAPVRVDHPDA